MKDYRLSEIKNHDCNADWQVSEDDAKGYREENFLRGVKYELNLLDIEPRDIIELPYKQALSSAFMTYKWEVFFRLNDGVIGSKLFETKSEADAFLAELKVGKE